MIHHNRTDLSTQCQVHPRTNQNWSKWSGGACGQQSLGRTNFSQAGPILDAKNGPAGLNLVNQIWSGRTSFGIQNRSGRTDFTRTDISVTVLERFSPQDQRKFTCRPVTSCSISSYRVSSCYGRYV